VETAYYTYNAEGQRIRKVIHNNSDIKIKETIHLDGYEVYHEFASGSIDFERETLHIMDDQTMIAMAETLTIENGNPVTTPVTRLRYQISDHLGSESIELSETGAMISFEEYYPYGGTSYHSTSSTSEVSAKRYRYNGKEKDDETNLYYYGARYYISWLGRWMNCDPIGEEGSELNLYRYASNNPVMRVDPTGMADIPMDIDRSLEREQGVVAKANEEARKEAANSNNSLLERGIFTLLQTATLPAALIEEMGRGLLNTPHNASATGQYIAKGMSNLEKGNKEDAVIDFLNATVNATQFISNLGGLASVLENLIKPSKSPVKNLLEEKTKNSSNQLSNKAVKHSYSNIKDVDAMKSIDDFLGKGERTNINPFSNKLDPNRIFVRQPDGTYKSFRMGAHEMKNPNNFHYHLEKWNKKGHLIKPDESVHILKTGGKK